MDQAESSSYTWSDESDRSNSSAEDQALEGGEQAEPGPGGGRLYRRLAARRSLFRLDDEPEAGEVVNGTFLPAPVEPHVLWGDDDEEEAPGAGEEEDGARPVRLGFRA